MGIPQAKFEYQKVQRLQQAIVSSRELFVCQKKELSEVFLGIETSNHYTILSADKQQLGTIQETDSGFWALVKRQFFRTHRPLSVEVADNSGQILFLLRRKFFFFFSDLKVTTKEGLVVGSIKRRFSLFYKSYDLRDQLGQTFARIKSPFWRLWTFPVKDLNNHQVADISKKWAGLVKEAFTDADTFRVNFGSLQWHPQWRGVLFCAAISIDMDFFEDNANKKGVFGIDLF